MIDLACPVTRALGAGHWVGVIHRGVRPRDHHGAVGVLLTRSSPRMWSWNRSGWSLSVLAGQQELQTVALNRDPSKDQQELRCGHAGL